MIALGVDVARFGSDSTAVAVWDSTLTPARLERVETMRGLNVMAVSDLVDAMITRHRPPRGRGVSRVAVDSIGIGAGVVDRLRQLGHRNIQAINVSAASDTPEQFRNLRAEIFWRFRQAVQAGSVSLPPDRALREELLELRFFYTSSGAVQLEAKEDMKKRVGRSPDRADACVLGWWAASGSLRGVRPMFGLVDVEPTPNYLFNGEPFRPIGASRHPSPPDGDDFQ